MKSDKKIKAKQKSALTVTNNITKKDIDATRHPEEQIVNPNEKPQKNSNYSGR